jgi:hypothetical protein
MCTACTLGIARAMNLPLLEPFARRFFWVALAAWLAAFAGLLRAGARRFGLRPAAAG